MYQIRVYREGPVLHIQGGILRYLIRPQKLKRVMLHPQLCKSCLARSKLWSSDVLVIVDRFLLLYYSQGHLIDDPQHRSLQNRGLLNLDIFVCNNAHPRCSGLDRYTILVCIHHSLHLPSLPGFQFHFHGHVSLRNAHAYVHLLVVASCRVGGLVVILVHYNRTSVSHITLIHNF